MQTSWPTECADKNSYECRLHWESSETCVKGKRQSPIIIDSDLLYGITCIKDVTEFLKFVNYNDTPASLSVKNDGYSGL